MTSKKEFLKDFEVWTNEKYCLEAVKRNGYALRYVKIVSFRECVNKMLCLATLGVMVDPCIFDKQIQPPWKPIGWTVPDIEEFQRLTRKLNMIVRHGGVDPEAFKIDVKGGNER